MWQYNYANQVGFYRHNYDSNELYHYGVAGMRWGVRRKQVTPSADHTEARAIRKKSVKEMTNQELKKANERMNLESNYRMNRNQVNTGKRVVAGFIAGGLLAAGITKAVSSYSKLGKNAFKGFDKIKKLSKVAINAKKSGVPTGTIARAAKEAFKMNYLK